MNAQETQETQRPTAERSLRDLLDLSGGAAIVTGGAMGIGQGIAFRLAEAGASVVIADRDLEAAQRTMGQITERGGRATAVEVNVGTAEAAQRMVQQALDTFGQVEHSRQQCGYFPLRARLGGDRGTVGSCAERESQGRILLRSSRCRTDDAGW